jgi:glucokinase
MREPSYIIGIDLGGTSVKLALFKRKSKKIIRKSTFSTNEFPSKDALLKKIVQSINSLISDSSLIKSSIFGVGIGVPGPVDNKAGRVYYFPNIPGWKDVDLKKMLQARLKLPVVVDNDTNLMALAELKFGLAKDSKNCFCLTLGTGVGGALILNGSLFRGSTSVAGEFGHVPISLNGPACNCGSRGCLERFIGNKRILAKARRIFGRGISLEQLSQFSKRGERKAIAVWEELGFYLGVALSGFVNTFNPDLIIIGGGLSGAGDCLFNKVRATVKARAMKPHAEAVKILKASLGPDAGLIGAGILADLSFTKKHK